MAYPEPEIARPAPVDEAEATSSELLTLRLLAGDIDSVQRRGDASRAARSLVVGLARQQLVLRAERTGIAYASFHTPELGREQRRVDPLEDGGLETLDARGDIAAR